MGLIDVRPLLDAEAVEALEASARIAAEHPSPDPADIRAVRAAYERDRAFWNEGGPQPAHRQDFEIDGGGHPVPIRFYKPSSESDRPLPLLVFLHGGGFILGSLDTHDRIARCLCDASGWAVAQVDYRLAPECKFPGQIEDCLAAVAALRDRAETLGIDPSQIAIGGDSAGANLSLACLVHLRDKGAPGIAGLLYYGAFGLRDGASRRLYGGPEDGLTPQEMEVYINSYLRKPEDRLDPRYNLIETDLAGLPPLQIHEVTLDPIADDSRALGQVLKSVGVPHEHHLHDGVLHGFLHQGRMVKKARDALGCGAAFLKQHAR